MTLESLLMVIGVPVFLHAIVVFLQCIRKGPSQYNDLLEVDISDPMNEINTENLKSIKDVQSLLDHMLNIEAASKDLFLSVLRNKKYVRVLIPESSIRIINRIFALKLDGKFTLKSLLKAILEWSTILRKIGFIPALLYLFFIFLLFTEPALKGQIDTSAFCNTLVGAGFFIQLFYVVLKLMSNIPELLMQFHPAYKSHNFFLVLFDAIPILKKRSNDG